MARPTAFSSIILNSYSLAIGTGIVAISGQQLINIQNRQLLASNGAASLDWQNKQLTGQWSTNTSPSGSGHLVNKGYLDARTGTLVPVAGRTNVTGKNFYGPMWVYNTDTPVYPAALFDFRWLYSSEGAQFDWELQRFYDVAEVLSVDFFSRTLHDASVLPSINWSG